MRWYHVGMTDEEHKNKLQEVTDIVIKTFADFGIEMEVAKAYEGFHYFHIRLVPKKPVRMHEIRGFVDDLRFALEKYVVKIEAPVKFKKEIEVKVINEWRGEEVRWAELNADSSVRNSNKPLTVPLGITEEREFRSIDIARLPHLLIGGRSLAGKSNFIHGLINSLILRHGPDKVRFILVDPKKEGLDSYKGLPHLLTKPISSMDKAVMSLRWAHKEMERRYDVLEQSGVMNINEYHKRISPELLKSEPMPYVLFIVDEIADLMSDCGDDAEKIMRRLAMMSRAVGIHLILATQSHEPRIVRGMLKANIPSRLTFSCDSKEASEAIIDQEGAEELMGWGAALFIGTDDYQVEEIHTGLIEQKEVEANVLAIKKKYGVVDENNIDLKTLEDYKFSLFESEEEDDLYEDAKKAVIEAGKASTSYLQRKLRIGYSRAARLMDLLEERGVIGPADGSAPREILED